MSIHISAEKKEISNIVLMPGDPKRCEFIAKNYLTEVKMINSIRNMNSYTGIYKGKKISIIPSGMGMPSIGIYAHELYKEYNVDTIIRIGTCGSYKRKLKEIILVEKAITASTFAFEYSGVINTQIRPNNMLNQLIKETAISKNIDIINGIVYTTDAFYHRPNNKENDFDGIEMETFALLHIANSFGKKAASVLSVTDIIGTSKSLDPNEKETGLNTMIELVLDTVIKL